MPPRPLGAFMHRHLPVLAFALLLGLPAAPVEGWALPEAWEEWLSTAALYALRGPGSFPPSTGVPGPPAELAETQVTTDAAAQNEPAVAVHPTDPSSVLAGWNDYGAAGGGTQVWTGVGTSHDGGATWNSRLLFPYPAAAVIPSVVKNALGTAGVPFTHGGDPAVGFNARGVGLAVQLVLSTLGTASAITAQATLDKGDTFLPPVYAAWEDVTVPHGLTDKPWTRGDLRSEWFYVCWTHFSAVHLGFGYQDDINIWFTASRDGFGAVWSEGMKISNEGTVQGCDLGVGPDGSVYVVYFDFTTNLRSGGPMKIVKSSDHGATWGAPVTMGIAEPLILPKSAFRYGQFPRIAVDPGSGALYVVWAEGDGGDIVLVRSTDGGATWSPKAVVNNDHTGSAQHFPAIDVAPSGKVVVGFYDRRDDPANRVMRYYLAESTDGGATFPVQVPAGPSTVDGLATTWFFMGDYTDLRIGSDGRVHAVWTAAPGTNQDIYATV